MHVLDKVLLKKEANIGRKSGCPLAFSDAAFLSQTYEPSQDFLIHQWKGEFVNSIQGIIVGDFPNPPEMNSMSYAKEIGAT